VSRGVLVCGVRACAVKRVACVSRVGVLRRTNLGACADARGKTCRRYPRECPAQTKAQKINKRLKKINKNKILC
jgi:hypothetical protein